MLMKMISDKKEDAMKDKDFQTDRKEINEEKKVRLQTLISIHGNCLKNQGGKDLHRTKDYCMIN